MAYSLPAVLTKVPLFAEGMRKQYILRSSFGKAVFAKREFTARGEVEVKSSRVTSFAEKVFPHEASKFFYIKKA